MHLSLGLGLGSLGFLLGLAFELLLEGTKEASLLLVGLVGTVTELGGGIDPLELDLLGGDTLGLDEDRLTEGDDTLDDTRDGTLDDEEVLTDNTIVGEATDGGDLLLGDVVFGGGVTLISTRANTVDLLVGLSTVTVTHLTGASDGEGDTGRMPGTDTSDLTETLVSLAGEAASTPTLGDTLETLTLGDGEDIDELTLLEDGSHRDGLLEVAVSELDLLSSSLTTVDLDFHNVGLLLTNLDLTDLSVGNSAHHSGEVADASQIAINSLLLGSLIIVLLGVLGEGLLLGAVPAAVETTQRFLSNVLGPHGRQSTQTTRSLNITHNTNHNHGGSLNHSHGLAHLLLVHLRASTIDLTHHMRAACLVSHKGSEMGGLRGIITRETSNTSSVVSATLAGQETQ